MPSGENASLEILKLVRRLSCLSYILTYTRDYYSNCRNCLSIGRRSTGWLLTDRRLEKLTAGDVVFLLPGHRLAD